MPIRIGVDIGSETIKAVLVRDDGGIEALPIRRVQAQPLRAARDVLQEAAHALGDGAEDPVVGFTGSAGAAVALLIGAEAVEEPVALSAAVALCCPDVRTVIEMGREGQKYLLFEKEPASGRLVMSDCNLGDKCAAGSGAFLDHIAARLSFGSIDEFADVALQTDRPATLSGRCSVFTESDIVHLYQKGTTRERIAAGVHQAICRNYRTRFTRGKAFVPRVAFIGGVSENRAAVKYLDDELGLNGTLHVPPHNRTLGAIGAALRASRPVALEQADHILAEQSNRPATYAAGDAIRIVRSTIMEPPAEDVADCRVPYAALGVDIGSVSTKAALLAEIDGQPRVLASYYRKTDGDPLAAVCDTIARIHGQVQERNITLCRVAAATTGSGRYLTGDFIGADLVKNEITAQAHGAMTFAQGFDTIFEIGGQDSKYIRLDGSGVVDFEMNKACAAGCGAFLEKQAARLGLPIAEFGDHALQGSSPPPMDWTCTVFTESAMVYYQQAGVKLDDLAAAVCIASVRNYLTKNVGGREIGDHVVFQGAVAFNKGMVAAFETVLGKPLMVPPYPHLTGAVGAARLALAARPEEPRFRGFEAVSAGEYAVGSFECRGCPNNCDVNTFQAAGGPKYFYNDRCEKYSAAHKPAVAAHLPDLFAEREEKLLSAYPGKAPEGAQRVGVPRGLMFEEYYPLYHGFLGALGFDVVPSEPTSRETVRQGIAATVGEPCFPFKVAHGHYLNLIERGVDAIFAPGVVSAEQPDPAMRKALTCPYVQAGPELLATNTGLYHRTEIRYVTPRLHLNRGLRHMKRVFGDAAVQLGRTRAEGHRALDVGLAALHRFRTWQAERGREVLASIPADGLAFVLVGRPYTLYDAAVNAGIARKVRDLGTLMIPQDFLPLADTTTAEAWPQLNARQVQRKMAAARIIRQDRRLRAVVLTYFACGPDSFANQFLRDELAEPCYVMQIDEHTADAGVVTRMEAFADAAAAPKTAREAPAIDTAARLFTQVGDRRLWVPHASDGARVLVAAMRAFGINAHLLPRSPDRELGKARAAISEDVCLPALMTTEDMLCRVAQSDFDPSAEAFFQGTSDGPCRYGMYNVLQRRILDRMGLQCVDVATIGYNSADGGLGRLFSLVAWDGLVAHDLVQRMCLRVRPYEMNPGEADALYQRYVEVLCDLMPQQKRLTQDGLNAYRTLLLGTGHLGPLQEALESAQRDFGRVAVRSEKRPVIGVVGEFYVRIQDAANEDVLRKIERNGGETWLAPATEFFAYSNRTGLHNEWWRWRDTLRSEFLSGYLGALINHRLASRDEHALAHSVRSALGDAPDIGPDEVMERGSRFLHPDFGGEAICSMGKLDDFAERGLAGLVTVRPFNCMPGAIAASLTHELRRRRRGIPVLNLDYDGFVDAGRDAKIANFMWQVRERESACDAASGPG